MAINRFDVPSQANFINTYQALPFQELALAAESRQQKHDEILGKLNTAVAAADALKYISGSEDKKTINQYRRKFSDIADKYVDKDLSDPEVYRSLLSEMRRGINKQDIAKIQESHSAWAQNQKNKAEMKAKGIYHEGLDQDPYKNYNTLTQGVYGYQTEALLDSKKKAKSYFDDLKPTQTFDPITGMIVRKIDKEDILRVASGNLSNFIDSNEGRQAIKLSAGRYGKDYNSLKVEEKEELATAFLLEHGEEFLQYSETPTSYGLRNTKNNGNDKEESTFKPWTESTNAIKVSENEKLELADVKREGVPGTSLGMGYGVSFTSQRYNQNTKEGLEKLEKDSPKTKKIETVRENFSKYNPELLDTSYEKFVDIYNNAINGVNNQDLSLQGIPEPQIQKLIKDEISGGLTLKKLMVQSGNEKPERINLNKKGFNKIGVNNTEDLKTIIQQSPMIYLTQDSESPGMYVIEVPGKKKRDEIKRLFISSNNDVQHLTKNSYNVNQAIRKLDDTPFDIGYNPKDGKRYAMRVIPKLTETSDGGRFDFELKYGTLDEQGNYTEVGTYEGGLNELKKREMNALMKSQIHGTNIDFLHLTGL